MKPMEQATQLVTKFTEEHKQIAEKISVIKNAVKEGQLADLHTLHSHPSDVKDLEPSPCPAGSATLVALRKKNEDGRAQCIAKLAATRDTLTGWTMEADKINVADLDSSLRDHRRKELARLEKEKVLCEEVAGAPHDLKGTDDILKDEKVSLDLSEAAKAEKFKEVQWQRIQKFCSLGPEVANALISRNKLPLYLDEILGLSKQCQSVHQIGEEASQSKKEGEEILKKLKTYQDADLIFKIDLYLYFFQVLASSGVICFTSVLRL